MKLRESRGGGSHCQSTPLHTAPNHFSTFLGKCEPLQQGYNLLNSSCGPQPHVTRQLPFLRQQDSFSTGQQAFILQEIKAS